MQLVGAARVRAGSLWAAEGTVTLQQLSPCVWEMVPFGVCTEDIHTPQIHTLP